MLRNLTTEVNAYCNFFLMPVVNIITETLVIVGLIFPDHLGGTNGIFAIDPKPRPINCAFCKSYSSSGWCMGSSKNAGRREEN